MLTRSVETNDAKGHGLFTPIARYGKPEEVGSTLAFLLSDESVFISGAIFTVDGGWTSWVRIPPRQQTRVFFRPRILSTNRYTCQIGDLHFAIIVPNQRALQRLKVIRRELKPLTPKALGSSFDAACH